GSRARGKSPDPGSVPESGLPEPPPVPGERLSEEALPGSRTRGGDSESAPLPPPPPLASVADSPSPEFPAPRRTLPADLAPPSIPAWRLATELPRVPAPAAVLAPVPVP